MKNHVFLFDALILFVLVSLLISCDPPGPEPKKPKFIPTSVTDIDGNIYKVKRFNNKLWMTENLRVTRFDTVSPLNGTLIVAAINSELVDIQEPYYKDARNHKESPYTDNLTNEIRNSMGFLYNWSAAAGTTTNNTTVSGKVQGICPNGWHLPTETDLDSLCLFLGGREMAGEKLKSKKGWYMTSGTNESGMNCYPAGLATGQWVISMVGQQTMFWSSKSQLGNNTKAEVLRLFYNQEKAEIIGINKIQANSVRCVLDLDTSYTDF